MGRVSLQWYFSHGYTKCESHFVQKIFILTWWTCFENPISAHSISFSILRLCDFGPYNMDHIIWFIFEGRIWTKIGLSRQVHHVRMNSFKHFSWPKKGPPRSYNYDHDLPSIFWTVSFPTARILLSLNYVIIAGSLNNSFSFDFFDFVVFHQFNLT